jgi:hypothetical protein
MVDRGGSQLVERELLGSHVVGPERSSRT